MVQRHTSCGKMRHLGSIQSPLAVGITRLRNSLGNSSFESFSLLKFCKAQTYSESFSTKVPYGTDYDDTTFPQNEDGVREALIPCV